MFGRKSPYEGRSAREIYGKDSPDKLVRKQCKDNAESSKPSKKK